MKKNITIVLLLIVIAIGAYVAFHKNTVTQKTPALITPSSAWPSTEVRKETINDKGTYYQIRVVYPVTQSASVNAYIKSFVDQSIADFKGNISADAAAISNSAAMQTLDIAYEERKGERVDNYIFTISSDTGGAHGLTTNRTFAFSGNGALIAVKDLFTDEVKGLAQVSALVQAELAKREFADAAWIKDGAGPREENYQTFIVTDTGVTFIFDPYQVAPYAAGTQTVEVPVTGFIKYANPTVFSQ